MIVYHSTYNINIGSLSMKHSDNSIIIYIVGAPPNHFGTWCSQTTSGVVQNSSPTHTSPKC